MSYETNAPITAPGALLAYFLQSLKPKTAWSITTRHEKFPFRLSDLRSVSYDEAKGLKDLLQVLKIFGWRETGGTEQTLGMNRAGARIALASGGQLLFIGNPMPDLHQTAAEIDQHLEELQEVARLLDIGFIGLGFHPTASADEIPTIAQQHNPSSTAQSRSCSTDIAVDYADEADMVSKMRVATALAPIATALFAASPFTEGLANGYQSWRAKLWHEENADQTAFLQRVFADDFGFVRVIDSALDTPMHNIERDGVLIETDEQTFRDFMAGSCTAPPNTHPTLVDWQRHLNNMAGDVQLLDKIIIHGADCGNTEMILAVPSFWTGLLYDQTAREAAWDLVKDWSLEEHLALRAHVPHSGLKTPFRAGTVCDIANRAVTLAQQGLRRRAMRLHGGADETRYLDMLFMLTESGNSYADDLLMRLEHQWHGNILKIYEDCRL